MWGILSKKLETINVTATNEELKKGLTVGVEAQKQLRESFNKTMPLRKL